MSCQHDVSPPPAPAEKIVVATRPAAVPRIEQPDQSSTTPTGNDQTHACAEEGKSCGPGCSEGANEPTPNWGALPAGTPWITLHVTGMHCGECAKKIERALAKVDGIRGVKVDLPTQRVEIAVVEGKDARTMAKPVIDGLGYHVD